MNADVKNWIVEWFKKNSELKEEEIKSKINENYFEKGWIDSFRFISFITDIEQEFGIHFSNEQFQDRSFSTIEGIIKIIEGKLDEKRRI